MKRRVEVVDRVLDIDSKKSLDFLRTTWWAALCEASKRRLLPPAPLRHTDIVLRTTWREVLAYRSPAHEGVYIQCILYTATSKWPL